MARLTGCWLSCSSHPQSAESRGALTSEFAVAVRGRIAGNAALLSRAWRLRSAENVREEILGGNASVSAGDVLRPRQNPPIWRVHEKRLKGLEPSTFCMAKSRRLRQQKYPAKEGELRPTAITPVSDRRGRDHAVDGRRRDHGVAETIARPTRSSLRKSDADGCQPSTRCRAIISRVEVLVAGAEQVSAEVDGAAGSLVPEKHHEVRHVLRLATARAPQRTGRASAMYLGSTGFDSGTGVPSASTGLGEPSEVTAASSMRANPVLSGACPAPSTRFDHPLKVSNQRRAPAPSGL